MQPETLKALYFGQNLDPVWINVENNLTAKQKLVNGYIEFVDLRNYGGPNAEAVINEEGKFMFEPNRLLNSTDYIAGPFFVLGPLNEEGYSTSLTEQLGEEVKSFFQNKLVTATF